MYVTCVWQDSGLAGRWLFLVELRCFACGLSLLLDAHCMCCSFPQDYFLHNMPWVMVPYADAARRNALSRRFGVIGIPTLVIINPEGEVRLYA